MNGRILIIGSLNMDMRIETKTIPVVGETVLGNGLVYMPGGKGANQACAAGRIGEHAVMLGCLGSDSAGRALKKSLENSGVVTDFLKISKTEATGTAVILVNREGNNSIVVCPGANRECNIDYLKENDKLFKESDFIVLQMEIPYDTVRYAAARGKELGKTVILNPAPAPDSLTEDICCNVDYLIPNETELMKLTGLNDCTDENIENGSRLIISKGVKNVVVTLGERGCSYFNCNSFFHVDAIKGRVVDTTAAGDCFVAAVAVALSEGMPVNRALYFANTASSIVIGRKGAQPSLPSREEVNMKIDDDIEIGRLDA